MPSPEHLQAIRQEIYYRPEDYLGLVKGEKFKKIYTDEYFDSLKTAPKGYPKDWEHIDLLKPRNYAFGHHIRQEELSSPDLLANLIERFKIIYPLNRYLNRAIAEYLNL